MSYKCKYSRYISAFIDGEMPEDRAEVMRLHVEKCAACHEMMLLSLQLDGHVQNMPAIEPSAGFDRAFKRKLDEQKQKRFEWSFFTGAFGWRPLAATAAVLLVLISALLVYRGAFVSPLAPDEIMMAGNLDLYENYDMIQHLDLLEDLDTFAGNSGPS